MIGTVLWFDPSKSFGFIQPDDGDGQAAAGTPSHIACEPRQLILSSK
jgi:'Cold-shock' DNA-binding domain